MKELQGQKYSDPYRARLNAKRARSRLKRALSTGTETTSSSYGNERVRFYRTYTFEKNDLV